MTPAWKRRLAFTRMGRWYTGLTIAIGLAATNTGNNLLFLVLGLLLASIVVSGILSEQSLKDVRVERRLPAVATAGQPALIGLLARNGKGRAGNLVRGGGQHRARLGRWRCSGGRPCVQPRRAPRTH